MVEPDLQEISRNPSIWTSKTYKADEIIKRMNVAFNVALEKLNKKNGTLEIVVQTGEAFGRGIFYEFLQEKSNDWTLEVWIESTTKNIFNQIGSSINIADISEDKVRSLVTECSFYNNESKSNIASFFNYGFIRGLLLSAFPDGELLMGDTIVLDVPLTEFVFKKNATNLDKIARNKIKNMYTKKFEE